MQCKLIKLFIILLIFTGISYAALPTTTLIWEVRPTNGSDTAGGCFVTGASGTDRSQGTIFTAFTDLVIGATTTQVTSVASPFGATDVGNCIQIVSGAGCTTGIFTVSSVASVTATLDRSAGTAASTCTANLGGALKSLTKLFSSMVASNGAWVKAESTITTAVTLALSVGTNGVPTWVSGYTTTRNDGGKVTVQATAINLTSGVLELNANSQTFSNFTIDTNSQSGTRGLIFNTQFGLARNITVTNLNTSTGFGFNNSQNTCIRCTAITGTGNNNGFNFGANGAAYCWYCIAANLTGASSAGFASSNAFACSFCIAANISGANSDGFSIRSNMADWVVNSTACNSGRDGFSFIDIDFGQGIGYFMNNISVGNGRYGFNSAFNIRIGSTEFDYNAYFNNTTADRNNVPIGTHDVTLTANPFNCAGNDLTLNNTAGGGAAVKAAGYPGTTPYGGNGFNAMGPLQPASATSNGSAAAFVQ